MKSSVIIFLQYISITCIALMHLDLKAAHFDRLDSRGLTGATATDGVVRATSSGRYKNNPSHVIIDCEHF